ncbi:MAG: UDP-glucose/GDP-mannose dehydrogenase family protein [Microgenomates group bacterium]|jgi:UDPglucose 6-dehydrogenase|nr:UDP-glucose/GDP-mannose dehydrogenase family protein [Candidatus Woesebacteria bacterium]MBP6882838.1 UDP-glucose/GDP-mannose dehydrogenase family protein [Candidatus Woesebacteria bacterium]
MTITVVGHGYVGLVSACVFADFGNKVWVVGHTPEKLQRLKNGDPIIYEPGLAEMLKKNIAAGRLHFTDSFDPAVKESAIVFITVGTPPKKDGSADLSAVYKVAENIANNLGDKFTVVSCKSTVPVGTNLEVEKILIKNKPKGATIAVASCPEFLREGSAISDTVKPDRVVIGSNDKNAIKALLDLHATFPGKRVVTNLPSAELIKYASNSMLATKISFANLISFFCEQTGADVEMVLDAVGMDKRIGRVFMYSGVGYGGSCFPKDVQALTETGKHLGVDVSLLESVEEINHEARKLFVDKVTKHVKGKAIAIWGLAFKPDTDDVRFAPSVYMIERLLKEGYSIKAYDAAAMSNVRKLISDPQLELVDEPYSALEGADALLVLTEWNEFKQVDLSKLKKLLKSHLIFDGRNMYDPEKMRAEGFTYFGVGRS